MRRAPSAGFSQGHRLVVVTEQETRRELARLAGEDEYVAMGMDPWISVAPVHVVVGVREESYHERYRKEDKLVDGEEITWPAPYWYVDCGSLFMLLQLAALAEGLGTGVYGVPGEALPELKEPARPAGGRALRLRRDDRASSRPTVDESTLVSRLTQAPRAARRARPLGALGRTESLGRRRLRCRRAHARPLRRRRRGACRCALLAVASPARASEQFGDLDVAFLSLRGERRAARRS